MSTRRNTSDVWYHFKKLEGKGECIYCHAGISMSRGSSGNLKRHLKLKHPTVPFNREGGSRSRSPSMGDESVSGEVGDLNITSQPSGCREVSRLTTRIETESPITTGTSDGTETDESHFSTPSPPPQIQPPMRRFVQVIRPIPISRSRLIDIQLLKMICKEYQPFSIVEDKEFKKFVNMLCPSYSLPSRKTLSNSLLPSVHNELFGKVKSELAKAKAISLTSDGWTSVNNVSFYALTAHFIDQNTKLKCYLLECSEFEDNHTAQNIAAWIETVLQKFEINYKITAIVTDNAANIKAAVNILKIRQLSCFAHSLNLTVQNSINNSIQTTVNKIKLIVQFFKKSSHSLSKLHEMQDNLKKQRVKLKQDVPTRWNSTFDMLERFNLNREPIISTLALLGAKNDILDEDWDIISQSVNILEVFNDVTREISAEQSISLSKTTVLSRIMVKRVKAYLEKNKNLGEVVTKLGHELIRGLALRFQGRESEELVAQAVLLDPRFKKQGFADDSAYSSARNSLLGKMRAAVHSTAEKQNKNDPHFVETKAQAQTSSKSSVWDEFDEAVNNLQAKYDPSAAAIVEFDKYLAEMHLSRTNDPLVWWESRKQMYPLLYDIMLKRLCIPATSVPCERIFSKAGQICTDKRSRLTSKKLSFILFLNHNSELL